MLTNRDGYQGWAREVYAGCREKYPEVSQTFAYDDVTPTAAVIQERTVEAARIAGICTKDAEAKPVIPVGQTDEQLRTHLVKMKIWKLDQDERSRFRNLVVSCLAYITSRISKELMVIIKASDEFKAAESGFNILNAWTAIKNKVYPTGNDKWSVIASLILELTSMRQGRDESIVAYAQQYSRKRDEISGYGDYWVESSVEGMLFVMSLNDKYNAMKNGYRNAAEVRSFSELKEQAIKWTTSDIDSRELTSEVIASSLASKQTGGGVAAGFNAARARKPKTCFLCGSDKHLVRQCEKWKAAKKKQGGQASIANVAAETRTGGREESNSDDDISAINMVKQFGKST